MRRAAASVGFLSALLLPAQASFAAGTATLVLETEQGPRNFTVELATTEQERRIGLMYRRSLAEDAGMLFLYDTPRPVSMWMKNTFIPLDMVFIDADGKVHRIEKRTEPFSEEPVYSGGAIRGILELKGGTADSIGLKPGDKVVIPELETTPEP